MLFVTTHLVACSSENAVLTSRSGDATQFVAPESRQLEANKYLAYRHSITIDIAENKLESSYNQVVNFCTKDTVFACTTLSSGLDKVKHMPSGKQMSADIRIRIKPQGVNPLIAVASKQGEMVHQSTYAEDLAKPIIDNNKRLKMLQAYQAKLLELETKAAKDIDALIKISSELSKTQSQLEQTAGKKAHFLKRTSMDVISIRFIVMKNRGFWSSISTALSTYSRNLSDGVAQTITATAYILPWLVLIICIVYLLRFLWISAKKT
jgi:hypothetical protein